MLICAAAQPKESFFHNQPRPQRGKGFCELVCPLFWNQGQAHPSKSCPSCQKFASRFGISALSLPSIARLHFPPQVCNQIKTLCYVCHRLLKVPARPWIQGKALFTA